MQSELVTDDWLERGVVVHVVGTSLSFGVAVLVYLMYQLWQARSLETSTPHSRIPLRIRWPHSLAPRTRM